VLVFLSIWLNAPPRLQFGLAVTVVTVACDRYIQISYFKLHSILLQLVHSYNGHSLIGLYVILFRVNFRHFCYAHVMHMLGDLSCFNWLLTYYVEHLYSAKR